MAVVARFTGGPRNGRKNNLQGNDTAPDRIAVTAKEAKAVNMAPGRYVKFDGSLDGQHGVYKWETIQVSEEA